LKFKGDEYFAKDKLIRIQEAARKLGFKSVGPLWRLDYSKDYNNAAENQYRAGLGKEESYRWAKIQLQPSGEWTNLKFTPNLDVAKYKGLVVSCWAGNGCEPTNIGLLSKDGINWSGHGFTKTQYAEDFLTCHLQVISILDICKYIDILEEVNDEGEYWETRDLSKLGDNITESTKGILALVGDLTKLYPADKMEAPINKCKNIMRVKGSDKDEPVERSPKNRI
jgi:hypothetical protein